MKSDKMAPHFKKAAPFDQNVKYKKSKSKDVWPRVGVTYLTNLVKIFLVVLTLERYKFQNFDLCMSITGEKFKNLEMVRCSKSIFEYISVKFSQILRQLLRKKKNK